MNVNSGIKQYVSIRQAARIVGLSHGLIRVWVKRGQVPGFFGGNRFYVNLPRFLEKLDAGKIGAMPQRSDGDTDSSEEQGE